MDNYLGDNKWVSAFSKRQHYNNKHNDKDKPFLGQRQSQRGSFLKQNIYAYSNAYSNSDSDISVDVPPKLDDTLIFPQLSENNINNSKHRSQIQKKIQQSLKILVFFWFPS